MTEISFLNYNIENLLPKLADITFINFVSKYDFVCLTETFTNENFDASVCFTDYIKFHAPAKKLSHHGRWSGGVLLLVKKKFSQYIKQIQIECNNALVIKLDKCLFNTDKDILLVACYVNPEGSPAYDTCPLKDGIVIIEESVLQLLDKDEVYMIVCGDMNARSSNEQPQQESMTNYSYDVEWSDDDDDDYDDSRWIRASKDKIINNFGKSLLDFCFLFDLYIMNGTCIGDKEGEFTFVSTQGCSVIDYFLVSKELALHCNLTVGDSLYSWHLPVLMIWSLPLCIEDEVAHVNIFALEEKIIWSEENAQIYKDELNSDECIYALSLIRETLNVDIDVCIESFEKLLYGAAACMVRKVERKKKMFNDWFDDECQKKKRLVKRTLQQFQRAKDLEDKLIKKFKYIEERKQYIRLRKDKKRDYDNKRLLKLKNSIKDTKLFWSTIRSLNRKNIIYNSISSQQWYDHFLKVFNPVGDVVESDIEYISDEPGNEPLFNEPISLKEILDSIHRLKGNKSAGPDKIINEMLKNLNMPVMEFLVQLFNSLFNNGIFPAEWCKSIIVPIHKKGDINIPDNYRGVALTSSISKLYTNILNKRLTQWAQKEGKLIEEQAGFRATYSTIDHIFTLYALVQSFLQKNHKLYVAFIDFKKAFDSVNRNILWYVLRKSGINGKLYYALRGIYNSVFACVRDKGIYSEYFSCPQGVKQGCMLSPQMFSFFINELAVEVSKKGKHGIQLIPGALEIFMLLFADDVILLSSSAIGLQNQLNALKQEADNLQLEVNLEKTNILVFRMGGHLSHREKWYYGSVEIKVSNMYKYLGMIFTTKLSLTQGWASTATKAKKGVIEILRCLRNVGTIDTVLFFKLFDTQIEPIITYAAEIWGLEENILMERVHTFAIKRLMNVPMHASNTVVYGECGRHPLYIRTYKKCILYWCKLLRMPSNRICKQAYEMLYHRFELGHLNWAAKIKNCLTRNGFGIIWLCQEVGDDKKFISIFVDRLECCFKQNWHAKLESEEKYSWFYSFKSILQPEKFLLIVTNKWHRDMLSRFRTRTMGFRANAKWFEHQNVSDNCCILCKEEPVKEDEIHFMFHCKAYSHIRHKYSFFNNTNPNYSQDQNFVNVLKSENNNTILSLAKYVAEAYDTRCKQIAK